LAIAGASDQLLGEAHDTALRVRLTLAQPHMQDLTGACPAREQWVIPALLGVPETDSLLLAAVRLPDETVDIDNETLITRTGARPPRTRQCLCQYAVELAHVTEGERPQKRPERGGRRQPATQETSGATRSQQLAVIDRVSTEQHREDQRHYLAARVRGARHLTAEIHEPVDQPLDLKPPGERRDQRDPGI
jgi:hypothetical protein